MRKHIILAFITLAAFPFQAFAGPEEIFRELSLATEPVPVVAKRACNGGTTVGSVGGTQGQTLHCPSQSGVECDPNKETCACAAITASFDGVAQSVAVNVCVPKPELDG